MAQDERMVRATEVQSKYANDLMSKANVVGVGVGLVQRGGQLTSDVGLVVLVDRKLPIAQLATADLIPSMIDGVAVDVQEVGELRAF